jgi:hypothetical protein
MKNKLLKIQLELKSPKNLYNKFGEFNYRSAETILETVKPICEKYKCLLILSDDIVHLGDRYYVKSTATIKDVEKDAYESATAFAREDPEIKKMHQSQITGSTSSYARKYALGALFLIDDGRDGDSLNKYEKEEKRTTAKYKEFPSADKETIRKDSLKEMLEDCYDIKNEVFPLWCLLTKEQQQDKEIEEWFSLRKSQIKDEENG